VRNDRAEQTTNETEAGKSAPAKSACVALVPLVQATQWSQASQAQPRLNSIFVTQLIATAGQSPEGRPLYATAHDAYAAYRTTQHRVEGAGTRPRQTI
jgi:hypothetical protein